MKIKIGNWASYLRISEGDIDYTKELSGSGIYVDYDVNHNVLGIEFLDEVKVEYYSDYKEKDES